MPRFNRCGIFAVGALVASLALIVGPPASAAQDRSYDQVEGWGELPSGVDAWGQTIGVDVDADDNVWVFHRCWANNCVDGREDVDPIAKYSPSGELLETRGAGMFVWPHGSHIDAEGNYWVTDAQGRPADGGMPAKGHQVFKMSPEGEVLMTLGTAGVAGADEDTFDGPADVAVAPDGSIFVADGHGNDRVVKFSPEGEYLMEWGEEGTLLGQFNEPHTLAFDSRGRLFVGDRQNQRIQVFDQDGRFLAVWPAIMASGIEITEDDIVLVADYQLREGIIIARAEDFSEIAVIDDALPEGVDMDSMGNVYAGEVIFRAMKKFEEGGAP